MSRRLTAGACGEAGGELEDAPFAAGDGQLPVVPGGVHGVPVDLGHRGAVADAGAGVHEGGEVGAVQESAVADQQFGAGFVGVEAGAQARSAAVIASVTGPPAVRPAAAGSLAC